MGDFETQFTQGLNQQQQAAVEHLEGPLLILAGAGSGKTKTITHRVARLARSGRCQPRQILAVTFTNKAAGEMKERLEQLLIPGEADQIWTMTFHALCVRILRSCGHVVGYPSNFTILDTSDVRRLLRQIMAGEDGNSPEAGDVLGLARWISNHKNAGLSPAEVLAEQPDQAQACSWWRDYQERCRAMAAMDFDDLLLLGAAVLESPEGQGRWGGRFRYITVDEYQDTNTVQYRLLRLLLGDHRNLCVVGDDDQSLYSWRGARVEHILRFEQDWPDARVITLEHNYRSSGNIIAAANAVIRHNQQRSDKQLRATREPGLPVRLVQMASGRDEANWVAGEIARRLQAGVPAQDIAVAYRNNAQSRQLEEALRARAIPYQVIGGVEFFRRAEIQAARAYLALLHNPNDDMAFQRAIIHPRRGVGDAAMQALQRSAAASEVSLLAAAAQAELIPGLSSKARRGLGQFAELLRATHGDLHHRPLADALQSLLEHSGYLDALRTDRSKGEGAIENLGELVSMARRWDRGRGADALLPFLEQTSLADGYAEGDREGISLMTCHATKGLEFPWVFLIGCEEELYLRPDSDAAEREESRRVFYVGMTRAMQGLTLSWARERMLWGQVRSMHPVHFLDHLPPEVERSEIQGAKARERQGAKTRESKVSPVLRASRPPAPRRAPRADKAAIGRSYQTGQPVQHPRFGSGVVLSESGDKVIVRFDSGVRTLLKAYARLQ